MMPKPGDVDNDTGDVDNDTGDVDNDIEGNTQPNNADPNTPTFWQRHKVLCTALRVVRDMVPSIVLSVALFSILSGFIAAVIGPSYHFAWLLPHGSTMLDKSYWHLHLTGSGRKAEVHVYTSDFRTRVGAFDTWKSSGPDDWWCILPTAEGKLSETLDRKNCTNVPRPPLYDDGVAWPDGDDNYNCMDNPPVTPHNAANYSFCVDIVGTKPRAKRAAGCGLIWLLFALPILADFLIILPWLHLSVIVEGHSGGASLKQKGAYVALAFLYFAPIPAIWLTAPEGDGSTDFWVVPTHILATIVLAPLVIFWAALAVDSTLCPCVNKVVGHIIKGVMYIYGVKNADDIKAAQGVLESDAALAFFLVKGYNAKANKIVKKGVVGLIVLTLFFVLLVFPDIPAIDFYPRRYMLTQVTTFLLAFLALNRCLSSPAFEVDYRTHMGCKEDYQGPYCASKISSLWRTLLLQSSMLVEAESCRFLGVHRPRQDLLRYF
jgi:hypothetical protein